MEPVVVVGMAPCLGLPSASPFCLKLETWLRMAGIPYVTQTLSGPIPSSTGKVPYIVREDGTLLADSGVIIDTLTTERGVTLDDGLSAEECATAHLVRRTIEEHLYQACVYDRWIDDAGWAITRVAYFGGLPWPLRWLVPTFLRPKVIAASRGHGLGRHPAATVRAAAVADVHAVATVLGDREWFFGRPSTTDAIAYGFFANLLGAPIEGSVKDAVAGHANLVAHVERVKRAWWA